MLHDCRYYTWSPALSGRVIAIQWSSDFHHSKSAQPMTKATGDNKDNGNAQRNEERRPYVSDV